jgi:hypothetical protein
VKSFLDPSHSARAPRSFLDYSFRNSQRLDRCKQNGFFSFCLRGTRFSFFLKRCSSFWPFHPLVKQLQIERESIKIYDGCCASWNFSSVGPKAFFGDYKCPSRYLYLLSIVLNRNSWRLTFLQRLRVVTHTLRLHLSES